METKFLSNSKGFFFPLEQLSFYQILKFDKKIEAFIDINFLEYYTKFWNEICHKNELNLKAKLVDDSFHESKFVIKVKYLITLIFLTKPIVFTEAKVFMKQDFS
jgi:hypothetical protein